MQALDARLELVRDLPGPLDDVVHFEKALLHFILEVERHDQSIGERIKADRLDLGYRDLPRQIVEVLPREFRQPLTMDVGLGRLGQNLSLPDDPCDSIRGRRHFLENAKSILSMKEQVVTTVLERQRLLDQADRTAGVHGGTSVVVGFPARPQQHDSDPLIGLQDIGDHLAITRLEDVEG